MHKNIVSNNLKEFVLGLEAAVKDGYSVVEETVAYEAGYFKVLTKKDRLVVEVEVPEDIAGIAVLNSAAALEMLDNSSEPNEKLKEILELDKPEITEDMGLHNAPVMKPNRKRK